MTRHESIEKLNSHLEHMNDEEIERLVISLEHTGKLTVIPGDGRKVGRHKPLPMKPGSQPSEDIIREARDSRENAL
jgi:hypothetical protein